MSHAFAMRNLFVNQVSQLKYLPFRLQSKVFRSRTPAFTTRKIGEYLKVFTWAERWRSASPKL